MVVKAGSTVLVPRSDHAPEKDIAPELIDTATLLTAPDVPETRRIFVKVGKKDSLASIAQRHGVSVSQIKSWNDLKQDKVSAGTRLELNVPNKAAAGKAAPTRKVAKSAPPHRKAAPAPARKAKASASNSKTTKKRSG
jgi:membrane-bound lytic murein transglycosylase D